VGLKKTITDRIEQYIKVLIDRSEAQQIEIQRVELAETFCCVPSQVSYVLATRFSLKHGYITESKRGGKGFVRITQVGPESADCQQLEAEIQQLIADLKNQQHLGKQEIRLIQHLMSTLLADLAEEHRLLFMVKLKQALAGYGDLEMK
jgi:transcriptional regulator CtsR